MRKRFTVQCEWRVRRQVGQGPWAPAVLPPAVSLLLQPQVQDCNWARVRGHPKCWSFSSRAPFLFSSHSLKLPLPPLEHNGALSPSNPEKCHCNSFPLQSRDLQSYSDCLDLWSRMAASQLHASLWSKR